MNRFKNQLLMAAGFAVLAGLISGSTAAPAIAAAIKAALVQNIDEPGRNPYQETIAFNQNDGVNCFSFGCEVNFEAVPAGKRLVITYASAEFSAAPGTSVRVQRDAGIFTEGPRLPVPQSNGANRFVTGGPINVYVDAGKTPTIIMSGFGLNTMATTFAVALTGYFVSVP